VEKQIDRTVIKKGNRTGKGLRLAMDISCFLLKPQAMKTYTAVSGLQKIEFTNIKLSTISGITIFLVKYFYNRYSYGVHNYNPGIYSMQRILFSHFERCS